MMLKAMRRLACLPARVSLLRDRQALAVADCIEALGADTAQDQRVDHCLGAGNRKRQIGLFRAVGVGVSLDVDGRLRA